MKDRLIEREWATEPGVDFTLQKISISTVRIENVKMRGFASKVRLDMP